MSSRLQRAKPPARTAIPSAEARRRFSEIVAEAHAGRRRYVIERAGIPVAALVPVADLDRLERLAAERERAFAVFDQVGAEFKDLPPGELERAVLRLTKEARRELATERERTNRRSRRTA